MVAHFTIDNIPFGIFSTSSKSPRGATAYRDQVVDLAELAEQGEFNDITGFEGDVFSQSTLNAFAKLPRKTRVQVRVKIQSLLRSRKDKLPLTPISQVRLHLPMKVEGFVDFLTSVDHAERAGRAFGEGELPLNFFHLPTAYHGRASTVVVSGTDIVRPWVQTRPAAGVTTPNWGPCKALDYELEMGCFIARDSKQFEPVGLDEIDDYIFGYVMLNDWSARDVQGFESKPLGPFLGKSFATSISPWIITPEALAPATVPQMPRRYELLPYLTPKTDKPTVDIKLAVSLKDKSGKTVQLATSNYKYLYFSFQQMFVSQTSNGCNIQTGDLIGSGTISGPDTREFGCLLEATLGGKKAFTKEDFERVYLEDYDEVIFEGWVDAGGVKLGFGQLTGKILPAANH